MVAVTRKLLQNRTVCYVMLPLRPEPHFKLRSKRYICFNPHCDVALFLNCGFAAAGSVCYFEFLNVALQPQEVLVSLFMSHDFTVTGNALQLFGFLCRASCVAGSGYHVHLITYTHFISNLKLIARVTNITAS